VPESRQWFGVRLGADSLETAKQAITEKLLDGNTSVDSLTLGQLAVLFGSRQEVQRRVGRVIVDLRAAGTSDNRWRDRVEVSDNVVIALRTTVEFLAKHIGVDGITIDGLKATSGTADYLAVREAVVNVLMHQDYSDRSAAAQIEVRQEDLSIFNPGKALVGQAGIDAGGKSQSRNPLIAKAMRLIGFAELAGSGLRAVRTAWRTAQRRAPKFMTNAEQNTFEVLLDWRPLEPDEDAFWKKHLGARVTKRQAKLLSSACQKRRLTCQLASEVTAASESESASDLGYLCRQMLLVRDGDWYAPSERAVLIEKGRVTS
jgi:predicted HTH transcriptional regulator